MLSEDLVTQRNDPYIYPIKMQNDVIKKLPNTLILTSEFDFYRRDSSKLAEKLHEFGRLIDFGVLPGLNHGSIMLLPSSSEY